MEKRIPSCIGFDRENIEWLRLREEGMADFINNLVKEYRSHTSGEPNPKATIEIKEGINHVIRESESQKSEDVIKVLAYFEDSPHIIYMAKTQRKFTRADLCRIKEELFFSKYNVDATVPEIRKLLKEAMLKFDVAAYEEARGIMKKV